MITLEAAHLGQITGAAEAAYPAECCGLLVGIRDRDRHGRQSFVVADVVASPNLMADHRNDRFEIDPAVRLKVEKRLRGTRQMIIGHYHSHPNGVAIPSKTDRAMVWEPELIWLITAVIGGSAGETRAYRLGGEGENPTEIVLNVENCAHLSSKTA